MDVIRGAAACRARTDAWRADGASVGLVTTMGALHAGHDSLLRRRREDHDRVLASIFVNPRSSAPARTSTATRATRPPTSSAASAPGSTPCGRPRSRRSTRRASTCRARSRARSATPSRARERPGHFAGVLAGRPPAVRRRRARAPRTSARRTRSSCSSSGGWSARSTPAPPTIAIEGCPTVREPDGLAVSSRNAYLSPRSANRPAACSSRSARRPRRRGAARTRPRGARGADGARDRRDAARAARLRGRRGRRDLRAGRPRSRRAARRARSSPPRSRARGSSTTCALPEPAA